MCKLAKLCTFQRLFDCYGFLRNVNTVDLTLRDNSKEKTLYLSRSSKKGNQHKNWDYFRDVHCIYLYVYQIFIDGNEKLVCKSVILSTKNTNKVNETMGDFYLDTAIEIVAGDKLSF